MLRAEIKIFPLLCGVLIGVYIVALLFVMFDRKKKKAEGVALPKHQGYLFTSFVSMFFPLWMIILSAAYSSALIGIIGGAIACSVAVLLQKKLHA